MAWTDYGYYVQLSIDFFFFFNQILAYTWSPSIL